jgi:hypothetical protein
MMIPARSTSVATKGADAVAGSRPRRRIRKGSIDPVRLPKATTPNTDAPTVAASRP